MENVTTDPYTDAERTRAAADEPRLTARMNEFGRNDQSDEYKAVINDLLKVRTILGTPRPDRAPTGPPGPSQDVRDAAMVRASTYLSDMRRLPEGSDVAKLRMRQHMSDVAMMNAPGPRVELALDFAVHQNPVPTRPAPPVEIPMELPALANGKDWPIPELEEGQGAADAAGLSLSYLPFLHLVRHAIDEGGGWTLERAKEHYTQRLGAGGVEELGRRLTAVDQALPRAPKFRAWLEREGVLYCPEVIDYMLSAWEGARKR